MKKIAIISPDTVPLPLKENYPTTINEDGKDYPIEDKCTRITALGKRSWKFAEHLSKHNDFDVTLLVPNLNSPAKEFIDFDKVNFTINTYNFKSANWNWSEELDRKLLKFDFVIIQSTTGTGFQNCAVLPKKINVILDGWIPFLAEIPCVLLTYNRMFRKIFWAKTLIPQYQDLLRRANCILYANNRQLSYYEGQSFMIQKLDWSSFKFSPLLKIPYGVDRSPIIKRNEDVDDKLKLLWYGPVYPWYYPEILIKEFKHSKNVNIDFVGIKHPRYKRIYDTHFKNYFNEIKDSNNLNVVEEYCDNSLELFPNYDIGIILARNWLEEKYSHRCRILEMASCGFPVIINEGNALFDELEFIRPLLRPVSLMNIVEDIHKIKDNKENLKIKPESVEKIYQIMSWDNVLSPLIDYIERF